MSRPLPLCGSHIQALPHFVKARWFMRGDGIMRPNPFDLIFVKVGTPVIEWYGTIYFSDHNGESKCTGRVAGPWALVCLN